MNGTSITAGTKPANQRNRSSWLLAGLSLGYFIVLLDTTVVTVALPAIRDTLGGGLSGMSWVTGAYTMVFASMLLGMGALADRLGAARVFLGGIVLFMLASVLCAVSPAIGWLIGFRALLGVGGAALLPSSLTIIAETFTDPARRTKALGIWAAVSGLALAAGPIIGGILVDTLGWQSIFLPNIPVGILSWLWTRANVNFSARKPAPSGMDPAGQLAGLLGVAALTSAFMESEDLGWGSPVILVLFAAAALLIGLFVWIEKRSHSPMLPLSLFKSRVLVTGLAAGLLINFGLSGVLFVMTLYFQQLHRYSALWTGLAFLALTLPMAVNPMLMSRLISRYGAARTIGTGFLLACTGMLIQAFLPVDTGYIPTGISLLLIGCGISFILPPLVSVVMSAAPQGKTGTASGALNAFRQLGATLGVALPGVLMAAAPDLSHGVMSSLLLTGILCLAGSVLVFRYIGGTFTNTSRNR